MSEGISPMAPIVMTYHAQTAPELQYSIRQLHVLKRLIRRDVHWIPTNGKAAFDAQVPKSHTHFPSREVKAICHIKQNWTKPQTMRLLMSKPSSPNVVIHSRLCEDGTMAITYVASPGSIMAVRTMSAFEMTRAFVWLIRRKMMLSSLASCLNCI